MWHNTAPSGKVKRTFTLGFSCFYYISYSISFFRFFSSFFLYLLRGEHLTTNVVEVTEQETEEEEKKRNMLN